jgi:uncharacterized protein YhhL (DUF1145 family)
VSAPEQSPTAVPPATETTTGARRAFAGRYGAKPWHLLSLLASLALTAYAVSRLFGDSAVLLQITIWFVGAAVVWDLVLGPALAAGDSGLRLVTRRVHGVSLLNYVRFPALLSLLLLLLWTPLIFQRSEQIYQLKAGLSQDPYLERWAVVAVGLFALSAVAFAVAVLRARRRGAPAPSSAG